MEDELKDFSSISQTHINYKITFSSVSLLENNLNQYFPTAIHKVQRFKLQYLVSNHNYYYLLSKL